LQARDNIAFRHLEQFDNIIDPSIANSDALRYSVPLSDLLPDQTNSFFRYNGSLTSGKCNEGVIWTIFDTPIAISERQVAYTYFT
jgi:carbonic anhydrase